MATEKRTIENDNLHFEVSSIIVDIEGTTTSINFVKETLFPYVRENLKEYVESNWANKEFQEDVSLLKEQASQDLEDKLDGVVEIPDGEDDKIKISVINNVLWQMDNDRKTKALKQLQGHIWKKGYSSGKLVGHIYDEVKDCLKTWSETGKKIYVYSSGSVEAQKLLFGSTKDGDLLSLFSGYFDTAVGAKTEASSYTKILEQLKESGHVNGPKDALFLTDIPNEAKAAAEAGLATVIVIREGNAPLPEDAKGKFPVINSFCDLIFEGNTKRRKLSEEKIVETNDNVKEKKDKEEKDVKMDVCPSDNKTDEGIVNGKSEESVENVKASEDDSLNKKGNDKENKSVSKDEAEKKDEKINGSSENNSTETNSTTEKMEGMETKKEESGAKPEESTKTGDVSEKKSEGTKSSETEIKKNDDTKSESKEVEKNDNPVKDTDVKEKMQEEESSKEKVQPVKTTVNENQEEKPNGDIKPDETKSESISSDESKSTNAKLIKEIDSGAKTADEVAEEEKTQKSVTESVVSDTPPVKEDEPTKVELNDIADKEKVENGKCENEDNKMEVDEIKADTKTDSGNVEVNGSKVDSKDSKLENGEPLKETEIIKTDTIKTNGTGGENLKNGGDIDGGKNGVADETKAIKEKVVDKAVENATTEKV